MTGPGGEPLLVASANVLHGVDVATGAVDLDAAARAVAGLGADVLAVQELDWRQPRSGGRDQAAVVARAVGGDHRFAAALAGDPDRAWVAAGGGPLDQPTYGIAVVSRWPITAARTVALPGRSAGRRGRPAPAPAWPGYDREPRVALQVRLDVAGRRLTVTATHLSYLPWRGLRQLRAVLATADPTGPAVIVGDLNLPARVVRALARGWRHAGGAATHPAWRPRWQPDQVLVRGPVDVDAVEVGPRLTSDHLPVRAWLRLR